MKNKVSYSYIYTHNPCLIFPTFTLEKIAFKVRYQENTIRNESAFSLENNYDHLTRALATNTSYTHAYIELLLISTR